ncbi:M4 family metallopeptidase [Kytococcus sp. Marseille-QA3725]
MSRSIRGAAFGLTTAVAAVTATFAPAAQAAPADLDASQTASVAQQLELSADEELEATTTVTDEDGTQHVRFDRTYKGLPVIGGDMVVEMKGDQVKETRKAAEKIAVKSTTPKLSESAALAKGEKASTAATEHGSKGELVVFAAEGEPRLAYEVTTTGVRADQTPSRVKSYVDAETGEVLASWDEIMNVETQAEGTGKGIYIGDVKFETSGSDGAFTLEDSKGHKTIDMGNSESGGEVLTDEDNAWGDGTMEDRASAGVDAHYGATKTYEYFETEHERSGIWDDGKGATSRVHYGDNYVNAFWDGSQMTYGDGEGNQNPLVALDVAAHEMAHGVTENSAGLVYQGDPGGLNEATSDIFGTAVEYYAGTEKDGGDYLIGEQIDINGDGTPLRYMDEPSKDGASPDCYSGDIANMDPHQASGPLNHWFYLASEGSGAKEIDGVKYDSPTCDGSEVEGGGREVMEKIWYRTLATKLTSTSDYPAAREGVIESAIELYGEGSAECKAAEAAMTAIDVPAGSAKCSAGATNSRQKG